MRSNEPPPDILVTIVTPCVEVPTFLVRLFLPKKTLRDFMRDEIKKMVAFG